MGATFLNRKELSVIAMTTRDELALKFFRPANGNVWHSYEGEWNLISSVQSGELTKYVTNSARTSVLSIGAAHRSAITTEKTTFSVTRTENFPNHKRVTMLGNARLFSGDRTRAFFEFYSSHTVAERRTLPTLGQLDQVVPIDLGMFVHTELEYSDGATRVIVLRALAQNAYAGSAAWRQFKDAPEGGNDFWIYSNKRCIPLALHEAAIGLLDYHHPSLRETSTRPDAYALTPVVAFEQGQCERLDRLAALQQSAPPPQIVAEPQTPQRIVDDSIPDFSTPTRSWNTNGAPLTPAERARFAAAPWSVAPPMQPLSAETVARLRAEHAREHRERATQLAYLRRFFERLQGGAPSTIDDRRRLRTCVEALNASLLTFNLNDQDAIWRAVDYLRHYTTVDAAEQLT